MTSPHVSRPPEPTSTGSHAGETLLQAEEHVLSTLEADGSRRWLFPRLAIGYFWTKRRVLAYFLIAIFTLIPHLRLNGKPWILLDVAHRRFTILGYTFLPTDTLLLALLMLTVFVSIFLMTALFGRVWCGWACPQTVYMEFLFRPIDRLFQKTAGKGGRPKEPVQGIRWVLRFLVYLVLCAFLAHTFLAYFVGTEELSRWMRHSPLEHPIPFLVMAATTGLMLFDFLFFREQTCLIACPYGRFQSVMLDRRSLIVSYDLLRGEPRGRGKRSEKETAVAPAGDASDLTAAAKGTKNAASPGAPAAVPQSSKGDCVDCGMCVQVCPTGIDIRNGLQLECIHCAQCIDACDQVMTKLHLPPGLIRYSNQDAIERKPSAMLRARLIIYPVVLTVVVSAFVMIFLGKKDFDAKLFRNFGNSYSVQDGTWIANSLKLSLTNRTPALRTYSMEVISPSVGRVQAIGTEKVTLEAEQIDSIPVLISVPFEGNFVDSRCSIQLKIVDDQGEERILSYILLGPYQLDQVAGATNGQEPSP